MKILRVHNRYQQPGGEDTVFFAEVGLLRSRGVEVKTLEVTNAQIGHPSTVGRKLALAAATIWSPRGQHLVREASRDFLPDIIHFDNTFPLISPAALSTARHGGVAVVQTLHNFRLLCPSATLFHRGEIYEKNLGRLFPIPAIIDAVYRDSMSQTAVVASMLVTHRLRRTWQRDVDQYIALTEFGRQKFVEGGLPVDRIVVKPNFVEGHIPRLSVRRTSSLLFVGRLSLEKGIVPLLEASQRTSASVRIAGGGPLAGMVEKDSLTLDRLTVLGKLDAETVRAEMIGARALVFPSLWYEGFPLTLAESFASGLPVIASRLGAMTEIVEDGVTGLLFEPGNAEDLARKMTWASEHPIQMAQMGANARQVYEEKYTPERNYEMLMAIYEEAIARRRQSA